MLFICGLIKVEKKLMKKKNNTRKLYLSSSTVAVTGTKAKERVVCLR